jgi:lambda family phage portal protein
MHAIMSGLKMLSGFEESAVVAARAGASKMGFFTSPDGNVAPLADAQEAGEFFTEADPGQFGVLPPGYEFQSFNPDYPNGNFDGFVKSRLRGIASGLGVAYHTLASDLEGVNFSSARAGTLEERDNWMVRQNWFIEAFLIPVFKTWLFSAMKAGDLKTPSGQLLPLSKYEKFSEHSWQGRRWQWVDPLKDIEAARLAIKTGIASPKSIAAQTGVDLEDILPEIAQFEAMVAANNLSLIDYNLTPQPPEPKEEVAEK